MSETPISNKLEVEVPFHGNVIPFCYRDLTHTPPGTTPRGVSRGVSRDQGQMGLDGDIPAE